MGSSRRKVRALRLGWARGPSTVEIAAWEIAHLGSYHSGNFQITLGKLPLGKMPLGKYLTSFYKHAS